jgi:hypothetical protein
MYSLLQLSRNPIFRHEVRRAARWRWTVGLSVTNSLYVAAFVVAYLIWQTGGAGRGQGYSQEFRFFPWLVVGTGALSLCSHWLIPPFVLMLLRSRYELRTLTLLVSEGVSQEESFQAQVLASVTPLVVGLAPFLVLVAVFTNSVLRYGLMGAAALAGALLWGTFFTMVSLWSGVTFRGVPAAHAWAYLLGSFVFPSFFTVLSLLVGFGCSAGQAHEEFVFVVAGTLTWVLLVVGFAATFWDLAFGQLFPKSRFSLWQEKQDQERMEP